MYIQRYEFADKKPKILIFTGAGISAESGISTFRDSNGLWENHKIEEVCNINTWQKNFDLVHRFYNERREQLKNVEPNNAHKIIAEISQKYDTFVFTQNVDNLLERAGCEEVHHLHGQLTKMHCQNCNHKFDISYNKFKDSNFCPKCNSKNIKPAVVFFGEHAPEYSMLNRAIQYMKDPDTIIVVSGTMGNVIDISKKIRQSRSFKILNNLEKSKYISECMFDNVFFEPATTAWEKIKKIINKKMKI